MTLLALFQLGSSILCFLLAVSLVSSRALNPLCARILGVNFALFSAQYLLAFLIFGGAWTWAVYPRVALAMLFGPLLLAYFASVLCPEYLRNPRLWLGVLALPLMASLLIFKLWHAVDGVIIASFFCHTVAALLLLRKYPIKALLPSSEKPQALPWLQLLLVMMVINLLTELGVIFELRHGVILRESTSLLVGNAVFFAFNLLVLLSTLTRSPMTEWMHDLKRLSVGPKNKRDLCSNELNALLERWQQLMIERELFMADKGVTIARAAKMLGVPSRHLSMAINRAYGASYSQYLNDYRVERAKYLLLDGEKRSVTDVFLDAGFSTKSHFHREFSRVVGKTPSEFRAQNP